MFKFSNGDKFDGEFNKSEMKTGVFTYKNGDEYAGDFKADLFDGYSLMKYTNGDTYCGDFLKGKRNGNGILKIKATGKEFVGEFEDDCLKHGQLIGAEGEYLGQFDRDELGKYFYSGKGLMKFKSGDVYEGMWEKGQMHGYGIYVYAEDFEDSDDDEEEESRKKRKAEYEGIFYEGMRQEGEMRYANGDTYIGEFDREGFKTNGNIFYYNGDEFAGDFE